MIVESTYRGSQVNGTAASITDAVVETFVRWPMRMTGATMDFVMDSVDRLTRPAGNGRSGNGTASRTAYSSPRGATTYESTTSSSNSSAPAGSSHAGSGWTSVFEAGQSVMRDQDLGGSDLKYVIYSLVFTKPGYECVLQKQQEELVNYAADPNTYAALKIAQFLDGARHGHSQKPAAWHGRAYPVEQHTTTVRREEPFARRDELTSRREEQTMTSSRSETVLTPGIHPAPGQQNGTAHADGWRVPADDQKYIVFLYHVDRRLPRQEEITRSERVVVERETRIA
jgi:hypothetical protein